MNITTRFSPNHNERAHPISLIILHITEMETAEDALARLQDPESNVSAHYLIDENGHIIQLVPDHCRAWHAGLSAWENWDHSVNSCSLGIELANKGPEKGQTHFEKAQIEALLRLLRALVEAHHIRPEHVLGHSDIAPARKRDPDAFFPWEYLAKHGFGLWPKGTYAHLRGNPTDNLKLARLLQAYGYRWDDENHGTTFTEVVIAAQRHFRPASIDGIPDEELTAIFDDLVVQKCLHPLAG